MNRTRLSIMLLMLLWIGSAFSHPLHGQDLSDTTTVSVPGGLPIGSPAEKEPAGETQTSTSPAKGASGLAEKISEAQPKIEWSISFAKVIWSLIIFAVAWFFFKYLTRMLELIAERRANLRLTIKRIIPVVRILGWTFVLYFITAAVLAPPIETLIALTASAGIAIGFASQDILKNVFGGIMILLDRPFQVGDKIEVGNYYGEVIQIGLRTVRIVTPDDSQVSIPNSEIMNQSVSNANSGESNCQVVAEFFLPPDIDIVKAKRIAQRAAACSRYAYLNKPITIIIKNEIHEGRSLLKMRLKAYVLDLRYEFPFSSEMTEIVVSEFLKHRLVTPEELSYVHPAALSEPAAEQRGNLHA